MARTARNRPNRSNQRGSRSSAAASRLQQSHNTFETLAGTEQYGGEVNAHLTERFSRASFHDNSLVPNDNIPTAGPPRTNNDIRKYYELAKKPVTGGAWLDKAEIPSPSEVLPQTPQSAQESLIEISDSLRPHRVEGAYTSNEEYLGTTYDLLREDAIRPLREAIAEIQKDPYKNEAEYDNNSIGIYEPVYITSLVFSTRGLATRVAFSLSRVKKHIRWEQSKRLITGTLVALSPADDAFQTTCVLATVAARPVSALQQNPPEIDLFFANPGDQEIDPMKKWVMVECRASFFEASRHTLLALQHMMREPFPLADHLVNVKKDVPPPAYIQHNPYLSLASLVSMEEAANFENVNVLEDWPSTTSLALDESQSEALQHMLTRRVAIVQGPPGTGKTFVSVEALKILRDNLRKDDAPIIVTAQTNHAVDQILRHTMEFEPNFIRLGGRSKDKEIKKRTLFEVRSNIPQQKQPGSQKNQAITAMRKLTGTCQMLLAPLEANKPPLDHRVLLNLGLLTREQAESLELESQFTMGISPKDNPGILMEQWLGKCLEPCTRPVQPDDYGLGFEEEDYDVEQLQELEAEAVNDDDDLEALRGPVVLINDNTKGRGGSLLTTANIKQLLRATKDLTMIPVQDRGTIYNYFKRETKRLIVAEIRKCAEEYSKATLQKKIGQQEEDIRILRESRIVGMTTTGLSKYRSLVSALRPRVVLVEEAAETMEAPVTSACFPTLEHLILVGDHQQLRPHTQVHAFEDAPYYLNLSLFERLVQNEVEFDTLTRQRRMIPEVRRLLTPIYGATLKDHSSVKDLNNRPPVPGMGGNDTFFWCHEHNELRDSNMSVYNQQEAKMVVGFYDYLVLNGLEPSKVTILVFYNGQRKAILRIIRAHPNLGAFFNETKVVTVDSYQGEENDVLLLSLARSNKTHSIGFLASENRACVALSRAKRGFYLFGNAELLASESSIWGTVVEIMYGNKTKTKVTTGQTRRVGYNLPLQCNTHQRKIWIQEPEDWEYLHGGCDLQCGGKLPCQHKCPYRCHPFDHERVICRMQCSRRLSCGHTCIAVCNDPCRCDRCDRRGGDMRAMLRPAPNGVYSSRPPPSTAQVMLLDTTYQTPNNPAAPPITPESSAGVTEKWEAYVKGGAAVDDARVLQLAREEEARYLEAIRNTPLASRLPSTSTQLIQVSPEKKAASENTNLLIDLDIGSQLESSRAHHTGNVSYAKAASSRGNGRAKSDINLLD